jgi:hypothetical protein
MKNHLLKLGWAVIGLISLLLLNLIFFGFVVGFDVLFGEAPQFTVPMFVPLIVVIGGAVVAVWKFITRGSSADDATAGGDAAAQSRAAGRRNLTPRAAILHSTLVIRRQPTRDFNTQGNRVYETSV